jgi:hypothetical protein
MVLATQEDLVMVMELKEKFSGLWKKYFNNAELPITFYYTNEEGHAELVKPSTVPRCRRGSVIGERNFIDQLFEAAGFKTVYGSPDIKTGQLI